MEKNRRPRKKPNHLQPFDSWQRNQKVSFEKEITCSTSSAGKLHIYMWKTEIRPLPLNPTQKTIQNRLKTQKIN
jgi:hypothetical protein